MRGAKNKSTIASSPCMQALPNTHFSREEPRNKAVWYYFNWKQFIRKFLRKDTQNLIIMGKPEYQLAWGVRTALNLPIYIHVYIGKILRGYAKTFL